MFDAIAPRYDLLNRVLSGGLDRRWRARAIGALALSGGETVLDLCTGTADVALGIQAGRARARRVVGVDFAGAMLERGGRKVAAAGHQRDITLCRADACRVCLVDRSVDAAIVAFGIRNVESAEGACTEMLRVLKPGGRLAILEFSMPTTPLIRHLYLSYFTRILPALGRIVSRHPSAYSYLPASVDAFPSPRRFVDLLQGVGFSNVSAIRLTLGAVYLYGATRPFEAAGGTAPRP